MQAWTSWVEAAQQSDTTAFGQLVTQFQDMAYWTAVRYIAGPTKAQDAAQEAFNESRLDAAVAQLWH